MRRENAGVFDVLIITDIDFVGSDSMVLTEVIEGLWPSGSGSRLQP